MIFNPVIAGFDPCTFSMGARCFSHLSIPSYLAGSSRNSWLLKWISEYDYFLLRVSDAIISPSHRLPIEPRLGKMLILACVMYCGDAMCTIAAQASSGTDFFVTDMTRGFLSYQQRNYAGKLRARQKT